LCNIEIYIVSFTAQNHSSHVSLLFLTEQK
jgi:hypothetical protein